MKLTTFAFNEQIKQGLNAGETLLGHQIIYMKWKSNISGFYSVLWECYNTTALQLYLLNLKQSNDY